MVATRTKVHLAIVASFLALFWLLSSNEKETTEAVNNLHWGNGFRHVTTPPAIVEPCMVTLANEAPKTTISRDCNNTYATACGMSSIFHDLKEALEHQSSEDGTIILAGMVDGEYTDLGINLHVSSIMPHNICNILYIAVDPQTVNQTQEYNMPVYFYKTNLSHGVDLWDTPEFKEKTKKKLYVTRSALKMGYKVLLTDLDCFYKENPLPLIKCDEDCDFAVQDNTNNKTNALLVNSGFVYLKSNNRTIQFYDVLAETAGASPTDDQALFNGIYYSNQIKGLKRKVLAPETFCIGLVTDVKNCTVYHANFALGVEEKKAKLKERHMWKVDENTSDKCDFKG